MVAAWIGADTGVGPPWLFGHGDRLCLWVRRPRGEMIDLWRISSRRHPLYY
jgi:hypothetical protein